MWLQAMRKINGAMWVNVLLIEMLMFKASGLAYTRLMKIATELSKGKEEVELVTKLDTGNEVTTRVEIAAGVWSVFSNMPKFWNQSRCSTPQCVFSYWKEYWEHNTIACQTDVQYFCIL